MGGTGERITGFRISALSVTCPQESKAEVCLWSYPEYRTFLVGTKMGVVVQGY